MTKQDFIWHHGAKISPAFPVGSHSPLHRLVIYLRPKVHMDSVNSQTAQPMQDREPCHIDINTEVDWLLKCVDTELYFIHCLSHRSLNCLGVSQLSESLFFAGCVITCSWLDLAYGCRRLLDKGKKKKLNQIPSCAYRKGKWNREKIDCKVFLSLTSVWKRSRGHWKWPSKRGARPERKRKWWKCMLSSST